MKNSAEKPVDRLIESAMARLKQTESDDARTPESRIGRRDYDQALAKRLSQLEQSGHTPTPPAQSPADPHHRHNSHPAAMLLVTALISALLGATLMWLAIGNRPQALLLPNPDAVRAPLPTPPALPPTAQATAAAEPIPTGANPSPVAPAPDAGPTSPQAAAPTAAPALPPPATATAAAPTPTPALTPEQEISTLIEAWRNAWSNRDADAYLSFYSPDFSPADGKTRSAWAESRRKNLASRASIEVSVNDLTIERMADKLAKASFLQDYAAGKVREKGQPKTLLLVREQGEWMIAGEWQGKDMPAQNGRY